MDKEKIRLAVLSGTAFICATCPRFWEGLAKEATCTATDGCGGPLKGDTFHEYAGPITDHTRWCFVCGKGGKHAVRVGRSLRVLAVCQTHLGMVESWKAEAPQSLVLDAPAAPPKKKKGLFQVIEETEAELRKQDLERWGLDPDQV